MNESQRVPEPMSESEVLKAIDQEIRWASDMMSDDMSQNRTKAWEYFKGDEPGVLDEDVSEYFQNIVSRDVADVIESTLAEIMPAYVMDPPAQFKTMGPGDEDQAALETAICNSYLMDENNGFIELLTAAKNALLLRIGVLEVQWETKDVPSYRRFSSEDQQAIAAAEMAGAVPVTYFEDDGEIEMRMITEQSKLAVSAVPVDEMLISSDSTSMDLDEARFVGRVELISRSDLVAAGYDRETVMGLKAYTDSSNSTARSARERNSWGRDKRSGDSSTDLIKTVRCYYNIDEDDDGIAEKRRVFVAGEQGSWTMLDDVPVDSQPFAAGAGYIWQHMPYGISIYDKIKQVQDLKTKFWRLLLEAGTRAARDRLIVLPGTSYEDVETSQFGGMIRAMTPNGALPIQNPEFPSQIGLLNEMADKARREGGGGAVDKSNQEAMPVQAGAHGVERMMTAIEELNGLVSKTLAETIIRQAMIKIHTALRENSPPVEHRMRGKWIQSDPKQWIKRERVGVSVALTMSDKDRVASGLSIIGQDQVAIIDKSGIIANQNTLYRTYVDRARAMGIRNPESYYIDPMSDEGAQAAQAKQKMMAEQAEQAKQQQQSDYHMQTQMMLAVEQMKGQMRAQDQLSRNQANMQKAMMEMMSDSRQFNENLALQYDELRVKVFDIESKNNTEAAGDEITNE